MKTRRTITTMVGATLLVGLVAWIGPANLWRQLRALGWVLPLLLLVGLAKHAARTLAWSFALKAEGGPLRFRKLLGIRIISQALAYLSSMGAVVSEPLKPWLLRRTVPPEASIPATIVETAAYYLTSLVVLAAGTVAAASLAGPPGNKFAIASFVFCAFGGLALFKVGQTRLVERLTPIAARSRFVSPKWLKRIRDAGSIEARVRSFRVQHPGVIVRMLGVDLLVQLLTLSEIWLVLWSLGLSPTFRLIIAIEAAGRLVKILSFWIPGRLGADEAGAAGSFVLLGLAPASGLALALARRVQGLCWTALGLVFFFNLDSSRPSAPQGLIDEDAKLPRRAFSSAKTAAADAQAARIADVPPDEQFGHCVPGLVCRPKERKCPG